MLSGAELRNQIHSSEPEENSRLLRSGATTPPVTSQFRTHSEGVPERRFSSTTDPKISATPPGSENTVKPLSGGVVAPLLNHRLFSVIPSGYKPPNTAQLENLCCGLLFAGALFRKLSGLTFPLPQYPLAVSLPSRGHPGSTLAIEKPPPVLGLRPSSNLPQIAAPNTWRGTSITPC